MQQMLPQQKNLMENAKYLYGASGHCKVIIEALKSNNITVNAVFDDQPKTEIINNIPILNSLQLLKLKAGKIVVSIGNNQIRKVIVSKIENSFFTVLHSKAIISENSKIGEGTVIMAGVIVNSDAQIGKHCIINTAAIVEHDCKVDDFVHISPNSTLAGNVFVGEGTHIGIGACVIQGVKIGKWVTVGAGAVILKDIPDYAVVVGNPGKIIKYNKVNE
ncbi:acetyltransferase [Flavobacterium collinsii]|jgi:sugar O-acyltransferase (sialic acid O-acetyltransferase NeuD family)|uniref:acetyltransferase n=1 Tax=Flavobacterium TaxID=237 RepID=UPI0022BE7914|nr:acetyltransferase [Flavobacterium collinsii]GIQ58578.1 acetyltransferase [Flavobacterium collinsii]